VSSVTNLILHMGILENKDQRIAEVNKYFLEKDTKPLISIEAPARGWYGGDKYLECNLYLGAFNYLYLGEFVAHLKSLSWEEPGSLQAIVKEQGDDNFRIIDVFHEEPVQWEEEEI
jgi:hypothetical protein